MKSEVKDRYYAHYLPLVREFVAEVDGHHLDIAPKTPQPFLPLYGEGYEKSALRMAIVGQDTRDYGCLKTFVERCKIDPIPELEANFAEFQDLDFVKWGTTRYQFWGFAMMFLAALHGRDDWGVMKQRACREILSSFAWGNGNAIEYFGSSPTNLTRENWDLVRKAGERFNGICHLLATLHPRVVIVLWKNMVPETYFAGYEFEIKEQSEGFSHYRISSEDVDIYHVPHPNNMRWEGNKAADRYAAKLIARIYESRLNVPFPGFVHVDESSEFVLEHLKRTMPPRGGQFDKFACVEWIAEELAKREAYMSVPTLVSILNELGYRTDYNTEYDGVRGSYNLVSGTYKRLDRAGKPDRAKMVAVAFRKPNFEYAYQAE